MLVSSLPKRDCGFALFRGEEERSAGENNPHRIVIGRGEKGKGERQKMKKTIFKDSLQEMFALICRELGRARRHNVVRGRYVGWGIGPGSGRLVRWLLKRRTNKSKCMEERIPGGTRSPLVVRWFFLFQ